eukprot:m.158745 g.158745  ORF g.158745 m.158745 type:complete len:1646 (-) comp16337_c1_seq1:113-5050(-)
MSSFCLLATAILAFLCTVELGTAQVYIPMVRQESYSGSFSVHGDAWQSFRVSNDGPIGRVEMPIGQLYYDIPTTIRIREGQGAGGTQLGISSRTVYGVDSGSYPWVAFDFNPPAQVVAGRVYSLHITCAGSCGAGYTTSNPYSAGVSGRYGTVDTNYDYAFRIWFKFDECSEILYQPPTGYCAFLTVCSPGQFVSVPSSPTSDRSCEPCSTGTYSAQPNQPLCSAFTGCSESQFQTKAPTISSDRECQDALRCDTALDYQTMPHTATTDTVCSRLRVCAAHEYQSVRPTYTTNRQCDALTNCLVDQYEYITATPTSNRYCKDLTVCQLGEYQSVAPTSTTNRACATCQAGTYKDRTGSAPCEPCEECGMDQYETSPCTATTYRVCEGCFGECGEGFFLNGTCTSSGQRLCERCLVEEDCDVGEYLYGNCLSYASQGPECRACFETCATCTGPGSSACTTCKPGFALSESGQCVSNCGTGMFADNGFCTPCHPSCGDICMTADETGCISCYNAADGHPEAVETTWLVLEPGQIYGRCVADCPSAHFMNSETGECTPCSSCPSGSYIVTACSATEDVTCESCTLNQNFAPLPDTRTCTALTMCDVGEEMKVAATTSTDRQCGPCQAGTYQDEPGKLSCKTVSRCNETIEYASTLPTPSTNVICSPLTRCRSSEYEQQASTYSSDVVCARISTCAKGTFEQHAPTSTTDRVCSPCRGDTYQDQAEQLSCKRATQCDGDQYQAQNVTATSDRLCLAITECLENEWERVAPTLTSDRECTDAVQYCAEYSAASDKICRRCFRGYYLPSASTCVVCPRGSVCDGLQITACQRGNYQDEEGQSSCKVCPPGTYADRSGYAECLSCDGAAYQPRSGQSSCVGMQQGFYGILNLTLIEEYDSFEVGFVAEASCPAGSRCVNGEQMICEAGTYSAGQAHECTPCGPEGYSLSSGSASCLPIPAGWYGDGPEDNVFSVIQACPAGSFCTGGLRNPCPKGTYQDAERQELCRDCGLGLFNAATGSTSSAACRTIADGYYGVDGTPTTRQSQAPCPPGSYCVGGQQHPCSLGTYQALVGQSSCTLCSRSCAEGEKLDESKVCEAVSGLSVCLDVQPPVVTLKGANTTRLAFGSEPFSDPGADCNDAHDGFFQATRLTPIPTSVGTHTLRYRCQDAAGLQADTTRTLIIYDDVPPVITLVGQTVIKLIQFDDYQDLGANVTDNADPAVRVVTTGTVDITKPGSYEIKYSAVDAYGNAATLVVRTVVVLDFDVETAAQTAANLAYDETLRQTDDASLAERAARRAYVEASGQLDFADVLAAAQTYHSRQSSSSSSKAAGSTIYIAVAVVVAVILITGVILFVKLRNSKIQKVSGLSMPYQNAMFDPQAFDNGGMMTNTMEFMQRHQFEKASMSRPPALQLPAPPEYQPSSVYYSSVQDDKNDSDSAYVYADAGVTRSLSLMDDSEGYGFSTSQSTPQPNERYEAPVASAQRPRKASVFEKDVVDAPPTQVYGGTTLVDAVGMEDYAHEKGDGAIYDNGVSIYGETEAEDSAEYASKTMHVWYKPALSREEAKRFLVDKSIGSFIVRKSSQNNCYAISVKAKENKIWNGLIESCGDGYTFNNRTRVFKTVTEVIAFCTNEKNAISMGLPISLEIPESEYDC